MEDVCFSRVLLLVFSPPALSGDGKTTLAPPRGVRAWRWKWPVAPSCQKRGGETGGEAVKRRGKGANFIPTAANRGVAFLFGHSPVCVPYDQFLLPIRRHPLLLSPSVPPALPRAPLGKAREAEETPEARNSRRERGGRKGQKLRAAGEKKVFWWRRVSCRARLWLAARASFPFPWSGPRAGDAGGEERRCRLRGCPRGADRSHLWVTLSRPESPCPGDAKTLAAGAARTRLPLKDISSMQAKHTPGRKNEEEGAEFNHRHLPNVHIVPKTSPRCADLS